MAKYDYRDAAAPAEGRPSLGTSPETAYLVPFFAFLLLMLPAQFWKDYQPAFYTVRTVVAAVLLWYFWPCYALIRWSKLWPGAIVGIAGTFAWIGTELAARRIGLAVPPTEIYNPDTSIGGGWREIAYLCVRVAGPSLVVPVMEELFFRDLVMRMIVAWSRRISFQEVAVGTFTWPALLVMSVFFGLNHGIIRWFFPGFVYGLMMGILLIRTKSLGACIVAHGMTNLSLYLYVICTGDWQWM